jgi:hypothetical protein
MTVSRSKTSCAVISTSRKSAIFARALFAPVAVLVERT